MFIPLKIITSQLRKPLPGCKFVVVKTDDLIKLHSTPGSNSRIFFIYPNRHFIHCNRGDVIEQCKPSNSVCSVTDISGLVTRSLVTLTDSFHFEETKKSLNDLVLVEPDQTFANITKYLFNKGEHPVPGLPYDHALKPTITVNTGSKKTPVAGDTAFAEMDVGLIGGSLKITVHKPENSLNVFSVDVGDSMRIDVNLISKSHDVLLNVDDPNIGITENFKLLLKRK